MTFSRTRSRGSFTQPFPSSITRTLCDGSGVTVSSSVADVEVGDVTTTSDVVTPHFRSRIKRGEIINNPFSSTKTTKTGYADGSLIGTYLGSCSGSTTRQEVQTRWISRGYPSFKPSWTDVETQRSAASKLAGTQALANIASAEVLGLVEMAELHKTLHMVRHPLQSLDQFLQQIQRSRSFRRSGLTLAQYISREWLRYRYGILPAAYTIEGLVKVATTDKQSRYTARGSAHREIAEEIASDVVNTYSWSIATHKGRRSGSVIARAGILYEYKFSTNARLGISFHEIPSSIYELIPYSFVVDWFANVGDVIRALTPVAGVTTLASWTKTQVTTTVTTSETSSPRSVANWTITDDRAGGQTTETVTTSRTPGVSVGFVLKKIGFDRRSDWNHLADAFSLIVQRLGSR